MRLPLKAKLVLNMTTKGIYLGGAAGALSALTLILTSTDFAFMGGTLPVMALEALSIAVFGMVFGGIFGMVAGLYSGVGMAVAITVFFNDIFSRPIFNATMGVMTVICTTLFFSTGLWHLRIDGIDMAGWNSMILMSVVIAVYASQRVANFYFQEWSQRKQKASA